MLLGQKITSYCARCGLSQSDLARRLDMHRSAVCRLESGETRKPDVYLIARIASILGTTVDDLLRGPISDTD